MPLPRVECDVVFATDDLRVGECANAFRVMIESAHEVLLDFCVYSSSANVAKVVSRVRVPRSFLPLVDARLREAIAEMESPKPPGTPAAVRDGLLVDAEGTVILFGPRTPGNN